MDNPSPGYQPELWAGAECSIVRVGDSYRDQSADTGHYHRVSDIKRVAGLNIKRMRYPILWERHETAKGCAIDWSVTAKRLEQFKAHNIEVIAGLLHHGSGPQFTSLDDFHFPYLFADYVRKVAERFPFIKYYTPVNEPLTTARFSGLYGLWYPHQTSELAFFRMLIHQLTGTVLAMKEIRRINPSAQLIQTEDLAEIQSTETLLYQARFENERKWLTYDLLCAKVTPGHFFWDYLLRLGIPEKQLIFFIDNPCPPDCMGFNYYITSERFLDERVDNYPDYKQGGNEKHRYVDTELVRAGKIKGLYTLLKEAWCRYGLPLAITECHLDCTREEQLRWIRYCWQACKQLVSEGVPVKGFTVWSVFGSCDWNSLLTQMNNKYETGAFDVTGETVRKTAVAKLVKNLHKEGPFNHPLLQAKGWWERDENQLPGQLPIQPLVIIGTSNSLAKAFIKICRQRSIHYVAVSEENLNSVKRITASVMSLTPWAIINTAHHADMDNVAKYPEYCLHLSVLTVLKIAKLCEREKIPLMTFFTDSIFNNFNYKLHSKNQTAQRLDSRSKKKAAAGQLILDVNPSTLIISCGEMPGPGRTGKVISGLMESRVPGMIHNAGLSTVKLPDLVNAAMDIFIDGEKGIWHSVNEGKLSCMDYPDFYKKAECGRVITE